MKKKLLHWLRALLTEQERGLLSLPFLLSILATAAVLFFGSTGLWFPGSDQLENGLAWEYELSMLDTGCRSEAFVFCLPLLAAFPAGTSVLSDMRSGFVKAYINRCGWREYITGKIVLAILGGGGSVFLGYMTAAGLMSMIYRPLAMAGAKGLESRWPYIWSQALVVFLAGAFFALLASTLGLLFKNRYMAYGGGFMVSYLFIIVTSRYLTGIYTLNPREWLLQEHYWEGGYMGCAGFTAELCVLMAMLYGQTIWSRVGPGKHQKRPAPAGEGRQPGGEAKVPDEGGRQPGGEAQKADGRERKPDGVPGIPAGTNLLPGEGGRQPGGEAQMPGSEAKVKTADERMSGGGRL